MNCSDSSVDGKAGTSFQNARPLAKTARCLGTLVHPARSPRGEAANQILPDDKRQVLQQLGVSCVKPLLSSG